MTINKLFFFVTSHTYLLSPVVATLQSNVRAQKRYRYGHPPAPVIGCQKEKKVGLERVLIGLYYLCPSSLPVYLPTSPPPIQFWQARTTH